MALLGQARAPELPVVRSFAYFWSPGVVAILIAARVLPELAFAFAVGFALLFWARPRWAQRVLGAWAIITYPIAWLVSGILLGAIFYGVVLPTGLFFRISGYNPMASQGWVSREGDIPSERYFRPY